MFSIHERYGATIVYMPGWEDCAHPSPHEITPANTNVPGENSSPLCCFMDVLVTVPMNLLYLCYPDKRTVLQSRLDKRRPLQTSSQHRRKTRTWTHTRSRDSCRQNALWSASLRLAVDGGTLEKNSAGILRVTVERVMVTVFMNRGLPWDVQ